MRSAIALEMEAAAIANASHRLEIADWIVVKGVMDYADPNKEDRYKPFAAKASAEVLLRMLFDNSTARDKNDGDEPPQAPSPYPFNIDRRNTALRVVLKSIGGVWGNLFDHSMEAASIAAEKSDPARVVAERSSDLLASKLPHFRAATDDLGKNVLKSKIKSESGRRLGCIRWSSGDEYFGEMAKGVAHGLGEYKIYALSDRDTPDLVNYYSGEARTDAFGKYGVYVFSDRTAFTGEWLDNHPARGYKAYPDESFGYSEYFGDFASIEDPERKSPTRWLPHGRGVAISHKGSKLNFGDFEAGRFRNVSTVDL
jgi:hypothetical protein